MSVMILVDSNFYLHTFEVFVVSFRGLRDLYSYISRDWKNPSSDAGLNGLRRFADHFFLFFLSVLRRALFESSKPV